MATAVLPSFLALLVPMAAHLAAPHLRFLAGTPRSVWLSAAGGVSVAYVFVHFLPELSEGQEALAEMAEGRGPVAERLAFLVALGGLVVFYGLHRLAQSSRSRQAGRSLPGGRADGSEAATEGHVFWIHMASFAVYNLLVGYLLVRGEEREGPGLAIFALAMALHFLVTDYGLAEDHKAPYRRVGRWLLVAAVALGWALGVLAEMPEALVAGLAAFLGGGIVLNVLKEEVPSERQSRFWAFALGAGAYAALLLAV